MARLILDTGAVLALTRGDVRVAAALRTALEHGDDIVVPPVVIAQVIRGRARDTPFHRLIRIVRVSFIGLRLARRAGALLGKSGLSDAVDALVMAEALRSGPAVLLTSDPDDMSRLAEGRPSVRIVAV